MLSVSFREWKVAHETPKFMGNMTHHIGLTIPMKWIPNCEYSSSGTTIESNDMNIIYKLAICIAALIMSYPSICGCLSTLSYFISYFLP